MKVDEKCKRYEEKIEKLFEGDQYNPPKKIINKKYELLKEAVEHFYNICKPFRELWNIKPFELNFPADLQILPFFSTEDFKRYKDVREEILPEEPKKAPRGFENYEIFFKQKVASGVLIRAGRKNSFPEDILCVPKKLLDKKYPMVTSSATSGNPSIEYNTSKEVKAIYLAYLNAEKKCTHNKKVDKMVVFGPSPEDTPTSQSAIGREACKELEKTRGNKTYYVLSMCQYNLNVMPKIVKKLVDEAYKNEESVCFAFSTQLLYQFLKEMKKEGKKWNFGDIGCVAVGGGGWDGKKGRIITNSIEPKEFVENVESILGIPKKNIHDIYGVSEPVPFACFADWSEKYEAFVHHPPKAHCSVQIVDENNPEEILGEGEIGLLKVATPVAIAQPRVNILIFDLVEAVKIKKSEVTEFLFRGRANGKYEIKGCGLVSSLT